MWEAFRGIIPEDMVINHLDGNRQNNVITNLEITTHQKNMEHASKIGLLQKGSKHHHSKLSENQVILIRKIHEAFGISGKKLGRAFNVCQQTISTIISRKRWVHI